LNNISLERNSRKKYAHTQQQRQVGWDFSDGGEWEIEDVSVSCFVGSEIVLDKKGKENFIESQY